MHYKESKGPCPARFIAANLYNNEKWFLQIDSHSTFSKHWDKIAVAQLKYLPKKSVLSHPPINHPDRYKGYTSILCHYYIDNDAIPRCYGRTVMRPTSCRIPYPTPHIGAGLIFAPGEFLEAIPFDPYLPQVIS